MRGFPQHSHIAFESRETIKNIQAQLLRDHLRHCLEKSPFYKRTLGPVLKAVGAVSLDNYQALPLTEKKSIEADNDGFLAVPPADIVDIVLSSGTTGQPIKIMYTESDLKRLAYNEEQSFKGCGLTPKDTVLLTCTMDRCFIAGLAYFLGIRSLGASAIRNGHGSLDSHAEIIRDIQPTVIVGVPSFLKKLGIYMQQQNRNPGKCSVSRLICIGEPLRNDDMELLTIGLELEAMWQAKVFSTYASSETITTFCECEAQQGGHCHPDLAIVEIIDDEGRLLAAGETGEVVMTPLGIEGMPLIRYKTGDMSFLINEPCSCGRKSERLGPILGRKKQMMKVKGTTVYPQAVYAALDSLKAVQEYYIETTSENDLSDNLIVHVAVNDLACDLEVLQERLQSRLRVKPTVILEREDVIRKTVYVQESRKPVRFFDRRKQ